MNRMKLSQMCVDNYFSYEASLPSSPPFLSLISCLLQMLKTAYIMLRFPILLRWIDWLAEFQQPRVVMLKKAPEANTAFQSGLGSCQF